MNSNKIATTAEKIKSFASCFIGAGIASFGTTYFTPQEVYRVPRILIPVLELFGNVGLAIAMIILGLAIIGYNIYQSKSIGIKPLILAISSLLFLVVFYILITFFDNSVTKSGKQKPTLTEQIEEGKKANDKLLNEINSMEKPKFDNSEVEKYVSDLEKINTECKSNNAPEFLTKKDAERTKLNMDYMKYRNLLTNKSDQEKLDKYNAKLGIEFSKIIQQQP